METTTKPELLELIARHDLTMQSRFVPFSVSRNAKPNPKPDDYTINWIVDVLHRGRVILSSPYMQGIGHPPGWKHHYGKGFSVDEASAIATACETGRWNADFRPLPLRPLPAPSIADVLYSLLSDASAIDYPTYEQYADDTGENPDSRKGEASWRECVKTGLQLRASLGESAVQELREAFQDY